MHDPTEKIAERHGMTEVDVAAAARVLRVSHEDVLKLLASGKLKSTHADPAGSPIIDYASVVDLITDVRKRQSSATQSAPTQERNSK